LEDNFIANWEQLESFQKHHLEELHLKPPPIADDFAKYVLERNKTRLAKVSNCNNNNQNDQNTHEIILDILRNAGVDVREIRNDDDYFQQKGVLHVNLFDHFVCDTKKQNYLIFCNSKLSMKALKEWMTKTGHKPSGNLSLGKSESYNTGGAFGVLLKHDIPRIVIIQQELLEHHDKEFRMNFDNGYSLLSRQVVKWIDSNKDLPQITALLDHSPVLPRPLRHDDGSWKRYIIGGVLVESEAQHREFKSLNKCPAPKRAFKIIQYAVKFICACLNSRTEGVIHFGVADNQEQGNKFKHGEITGIECNDQEVRSRFNFVVEHQIHPGGATLLSNCIKLYFVPVQNSPKQVVEIEVLPSWDILQGNVFAFTKFKKKDPKKKLQNVPAQWKPDHDYEHDRENTIFAFRQENESKKVDAAALPPLVRGLQTGYENYLRNRSSRSTASPNPDLKNQIDRQLFLTSSNIHYVLVSTPMSNINLKQAFLKIPWDMMIELDPNSDLESIGRQELNILHPSDAHLIKQKDCMEKCMFLFGNGRKDTNFQQPEDYSSWIETCKNGIDRAINLVADTFTEKRIIVVFLWFTSDLNDQISDILTTCKSRNLHSVLFVDNSLQIPTLRMTVKKEQWISTNEWLHVEEIILEHTSKQSLLKDGSKDIISSSGHFVRVDSATLERWPDIEVVSSSGSSLDIKREVQDLLRDNFYRGKKVDWINFMCSHDVSRTATAEILSKVEEQLRCNADTRPLVTIYHEPGTGGTTISRKILWSLRDRYRCCLLKTFTPSTVTQISEFRRYRDTNNPQPVLILAENLEDMSEFIYWLGRAKLAAVIVHNKRNLWKEDKMDILRNSPLNFYLEAKLDQPEVNGFHKLIQELQAHTEQQKDALLQKIKQKKGIVYVVLEIFAFNFEKDEVAKLVSDRLNDIGQTDQQILKYCAFVDYYGDAAIPCACLDYLAIPDNSPVQTNRTRIEDVVSMPASSLLIDDETMNDSWRTAHHLIANEILDQLQCHPLEVFKELLNSGMIHNSFRAPHKLLAEAISKILKRRAFNTDSEEDYKFSRFIEEMRKKRASNDEITGMFAAATCVAEKFQEWEIMHQYARWLRFLSEFKEADEVLKKTIAYSPDSRYYVTKGYLYYDQLKNLGEVREATDMSKQIELAHKACEDFDAAIAKDPKNLFAIIARLKANNYILKQIFSMHGNSIASVMELFTKSSVKIKGLVLTQEQQRFVNTLMQITVHQFERLFEHNFFEKASRVNKEEKSIQWALEQRREFYKLFGDHARKLLQSSLKSSTYLLFVVDEALCRHKETPFSSWNSISEKHSLFHTMFSTLFSAVESKNRQLLSDIENVILVRSWLALQHQQKFKVPSASSIGEYLRNWAQKRGSSSHGQFYCYVFHFPFPNNLNPLSALYINDTIKRCSQALKAEMKADRAFYFAGTNGTIIPAHDINYVNKPRNDSFWEDSKVREKLVRLRGTLSFGDDRIDFETDSGTIRIRYNLQLLRIRNSREKVEFFLGFTYVGPFAYDVKVAERSRDSAESTNILSDNNNHV